MNASKSSLVLARPLRAASLLIALGGAAACTAILAPKDDVQRCGNADDCDPIDDKRYVPLCEFGESDEELDSDDTDKICYAAYNPSVGCDPMVYSTMTPVGEHPYWVTYDKSSCRSPSCPEGSDGKRGCPTLEGGECLEGQGTRQEYVNADGQTRSFCGDEGEIPAFALDGDLEGQHVKDQFCKSYFCDADFVCNDSNKCVPCDPDRDYGDGGCGTVVNDGGPAAVYVFGDELEKSCPGKADIANPLFGAC